MNILNTIPFLKTTGYLGLFIIIYAETGILVGLILPGESLLFTAGLLSSLGYFDIRIIITVTFVAAILADSSGYAVGKKYDTKIFSKNNSLLLDKSNIEKAEKFYAKHGGKTIVIARFVPILRTVAPILAGVGKMPYSIFLLYNLAGALLWSISISLIGFYLGKAIPQADKYILLIILSIIIVATFPAFLAFIHDKNRRRQTINYLKQHLRCPKKRYP